jgi:hypothetical protein
MAMKLATQILGFQRLPGLCSRSIILFCAVRIVVIASDVVDVFLVASGILVVANEMTAIVKGRYPLEDRVGKGDIAEPRKGIN